MALKGLALLLLQATVVVGVPKCKPRTRTTVGVTGTTDASDTLGASSSVSSAVAWSSSIEPTVSTAIESTPSVTGSSTNEPSGSTEASSGTDPAVSSTEAASTDPSPSVSASPDPSSTTPAPASSTASPSVSDNSPSETPSPTQLSSSESSSETPASTEASSDDTPTLTTGPTPSSIDDEPLLLTGVVATATTSATSCYAIPTPTYYYTRADLGELDSDLAGYFMLINGLGQPVYLEVTLDGVQYLVDVHDPEKLVIIDPDQNTLIVDDAGLRFSDRRCATDVHIAVPNMFDQLAGLAEDDNDASPAQWRKRDAGVIVPRAPQQNFTVRLKIQDQCSNGISDVSLTLGASPCSRLLPMDEWGQHLWSCDWPGEQHPHSRCLDTVNLFGDKLTVSLSLLSLLAKGGLTAVAVRRMVVQALLAASVATGGLATPVVVALVAVIAALETLDELVTVINAGDPHRLAKFLCYVLSPTMGSVPQDIRFTMAQVPGYHIIATGLRELPQSITPQAFRFQLHDSRCECVRRPPCSSAEFFPECPGGECLCIHGADDDGTGRQCYAGGGIITLDPCDSDADCYPGQRCITQYTYYNQFRRRTCGSPGCHVGDICYTVPR